MKRLTFTISKGKPTEISNQNDIHQDAVIGICRDKSGELWALAGHIGYGHIEVLRGTDASNLQTAYPIAINFEYGSAGNAFNGSRYPDGPFSRGEFWPTGFWIDHKTGWFHALIHNETGWAAGTDAYTVYGQEEGEPDFRHIGYIYSKDQGRTWDFDRWVITAREPCYSELYRPDHLTQGQAPGIVCLGAGDLSVFYRQETEELFLYYSMIWYDTDGRRTAADKIYCAKSSVGSDGKLREFQKYCDGSFCTTGNCGRESAILSGGAEPCVAYSETAGRFIMTTYNRTQWEKNAPTLQVSYSDDLVTWSEPEQCVSEHSELSLPYFTLVGRNAGKPHNHLGDSFHVLANTNNTDVMCFEVDVSSVDE